MSRHPLTGSGRVVFVLATLLVCAVGALSQKKASADTLPGFALRTFSARSIGPAIMGGRVSDIAIDPTDPYTFYVGLGTGGVMKTSNDGGTFAGIFEKEEVAAVGAIADGTYTGGTFTNRWGPVQVEVTYQGGSITAVNVLQYPDADRKSVMINQRALPRYESETIAAQSADIASVTGAQVRSQVLVKPRKRVRSTLRRITEVSDSLSELTPLARWSGTDAVLGSLDLAIHSMARTLDQLWAMQDAVKRARSGGGPTFIEAHTYRIQGHLEAEDLFLGGQKYREKHEIEAWKGRCPIAFTRGQLAGNAADVARLEEIEKRDLLGEAQRVGKTLVARTLAEFFHADGRSVAAFDVNPDQFSLVEYLPADTAVASVEDTRGKMALFDQLVQPDGVPKVVDLGHSEFDRFFTVMQDIGFAREAHVNAIVPAVLFVCDQDVRSRQGYAMLRDRFPSLPIVLVSAAADSQVAAPGGPPRR